MKEFQNELEPVRPGIVYRLFNPQVPVIVCAKFGDEIAAMPANSCSSASDNPPLISLAVRKGINTNLVIRSSLSFSINWINFKPMKSRRIVLELASPSMNSKNKLAHYKVGYSIVSKIPVLTEARAYALCKVERRISSGDHDLFLAKVISAKAIGDFTQEGYWRFKDYKPILYVGSTRKNPLITI